MLAAVPRVSMCAGIRREDAGPSGVAGFADFGALVRGRAAKVEVVGSSAVCWSSTCSRVLAEPAAAAAAAAAAAEARFVSEEENRPGDAARRCKECTSYLDSVLLPRAKEACAAAAVAAAGGGGSAAVATAAAAAASTVGSGGGSGGSEKREARESATGTRRRVDESRRDSPAVKGTTSQHQNNDLGRVGRREVSPRAAEATESANAAQEVGRA